MTVEPILGSVWGPGNPVTFAKGGPDPLLMHSRPADGRGGNAEHAVGFLQPKLPPTLILRREKWWADGSCNGREGGKATDHVIMRGKKTILPR